MGNQQTKTKDITAEQYAEYMKLKQEQEYKKQMNNYEREMKKYGY